MACAKMYAAFSAKLGAANSAIDTAWRHVIIGGIIAAAIAAAREA